MNLAVLFSLAIYILLMLDTLLCFFNRQINTLESFHEASPSPSSLAHPAHHTHDKLSVK